MAQGTNRLELAQPSFVQLVDTYVPCFALRWCALVSSLETKMYPHSLKPLLLVPLCMYPTFNYIWRAAIKIQSPPVSAGPLLLLCSSRPRFPHRLQTFISHCSMNSTSLRFSVFLSALFSSLSLSFAALHLFVSAFHTSYPVFCTPLRFCQVLSYLCLSAHLPLHPSHRVRVRKCVFVCVSPSLLAQQQIWFITFLMLFVIALHSQHVKSKSFFQSIHLCLVCRDLNEPSASVVLKMMLFFFFFLWASHSTWVEELFSKDAGLQLHSEENNVFYL